jgi:hypothetical protein
MSEHDMTWEEANALGAALIDRCDINDIAWSCFINWFIGFNQGVRSRASIEDCIKECGDIRDDWHVAVMDYCKSPIEQILLTYAFVYCGRANLIPKFWFSDLPFPRPTYPLLFAPQFESENYRIDLAVFSNDLKIVRLILTEQLRAGAHEQISRYAAFPRELYGRLLAFVRRRTRPISTLAHAHVADAGLPDPERRRLDCSQAETTG